MKIARFKSMLLLLALLAVGTQYVEAMQCFSMAKNLIKKIGYAV